MTEPEFSIDRRYKQDKRFHRAKETKGKKEMKDDVIPTLEWQIYPFCLPQTQPSQDNKYRGNIP